VCVQVKVTRHVQDAECVRDKESITNVSVYVRVHSCEIISTSGARYKWMFSVVEHKTQWQHKINN